MRLLLIAILWLFATIGQASAHAIIMDSTPAPNADLPLGEGPYVLKFNSRIDRARSKMFLLTPSKQKMDMPIVKDFDATGLMITGMKGDPGPNVLVSAGPPAALGPGAYKLHWQVLSTDGHITRGNIPFIATSPIDQNTK